VIAKRNHYLPQFYLEYFIPASRPAHFWVYDKEGGNPRPQTPINTGVEGHLYTVLNEDGAKDDFIETQVLSPLDGVAKSILDRWADPQSRIQEEEIPVIAEFLAFFDTRVPRNIEMVREMGKLLALKHSKDLSADPDRLMRYIERYKSENPDEKVPGLDEVREWFRNPETRFKFSTNRTVAMVLSFLSSQTIFEELITMNWQLFRIPEGSELVTCDSPLVSFVRDGKGRAMFGAGFGLQGIEVSFPITPSACLFLDHPEDGLEITPNEHFVREMNKRTVYMAERFVVSRSRSEEVADLVQRFSLTRKQPKLDQFDLFKYLEQNLRELVRGNET
jgi:hypothetical protein